MGKAAGAIVFLVILVTGCGSSSTVRTVTRTTTVRVEASAKTGVVLTPSQVRAVALLTTRGADPSQPDPAVAEIRNGSDGVKVDVTYRCWEGPGRTYFSVDRQGKVRVLGTSAQTEGLSGIEFCIPG